MSVNTPYGWVFLIHNVCTGQPGSGTKPSEFFQPQA
jgi:hypothetical protein